MKFALYDENASIKEVGNFVMETDARRNAFLSALVNRIALVLISSKLWRNKFARYKRGYLELGETVEDIFVNIAKPFSYDPEEAEETWLRRELPDVRAAFYTMNYQKFYKVTVQRNDLSKAFLAWSGVNQLVAYIVNSLYAGMEYDEFITTKYMLGRYLVNGHMKTITIAEPNTKENIEQAVVAVRDNSMLMEYPDPSFNQAHVMNFATIDQQTVWITTNLNARMDVDVLAKAFNMDRTTFLGHLEVINSLVPTDVEEERLNKLFANVPEFEAFSEEEKGKLEKVDVIVTSTDSFMIFDNLNEMNEQRNPQGLYWNYWLHAWRTYAMSPFAPMYALNHETNEVSTVTVAPGTAQVAQGTSIQMQATVKTSGLALGDVVWSISGDSLSSGTKIDPSTGLLFVAENEEVGHTITVTATAGGKSNTATITVTAREGE